MTFSLGNIVQIETTTIRHEEDCKTLPERPLYYWRPKQKWELLQDKGPSK